MLPASLPWKALAVVCKKDAFIKSYQLRQMVTRMNEKVEDEGWQLIVFVRQFRICI